MKNYLGMKIFKAMQWVANLQGIQFYFMLTLLALCFMMVIGWLVFAPIKEIHPAPGVRCFETGNIFNRSISCWETKRE